jgi:hypothetical protein
VSADLYERRSDAAICPSVERSDGDAEIFVYVLRVEQRLWVVIDSCHDGTLADILRLVNSGTSRSKKDSIEEQTRVAVVTRLIDPRDPRKFEVFLEVRQEMEGDLEGLESVIRVDLVDGELRYSSSTYTAATSLPLASAGGRALRKLRHGDIGDIIEKSLVRLADEGEEAGATVLPFLNAARAHTRRPGRKGTPDLIHADVAKKRMLAEEAEAGAAIKWMVNKWPEDFVSVSAADAKVNKARARGMLEGRGKTLRLTERARELLEGKTP